MSFAPMALFIAGCFAAMAIGLAIYAAIAYKNGHLFGKSSMEPMRIPYVLSSGALAWIYQGERIIDNTKGKDMQKEFEIYVDGAHIGSADDDMFMRIREVTDPLMASMGICYGPVNAKARIAVGGRAPLVIRKIIALMDGAKEPTLKDAAAAFEKAINSEPGIEAKIVSIGAHDIAAVITHTKWSVKVTRNERKQVYP